MRIRLIDGKYDAITLIVPDDTLRYHPEGTKDIAYENQGYRIGSDVVFKLTERIGDTSRSPYDVGPIGQEIVNDLQSRRVLGKCPGCGETIYEGLTPSHKLSCGRDKDKEQL